MSASEFALAWVGGVVSSGLVYALWPKIESVYGQVKMLFGRSQFVARCEVNPVVRYADHSANQWRIRGAEWMAERARIITERRLKHPEQSNTIRALDKNIALATAHELRMCALSTSARARMTAALKGEVK